MNGICLVSNIDDHGWKTVIFIVRSIRSIDFWSFGWCKYTINRVNCPGNTTILQSRHVFIERYNWRSILRSTWEIGHLLSSSFLPILFAFLEHFPDASTKKYARIVGILARYWLSRCKMDYREISTKFPCYSSYLL